MAALRNSSIFTGAVLSMVDGKRSIRELSRALGAQWRVDSEALEPRLCAFFERLSSAEPAA